MASNIDPTKPAGPIAYTADVRDNFAAAADEITALQAAGPFLPIDGSVPMTGPLQLPSGSATAPALQLGDADGTGFWRAPGNVVGLGVAGSFIAAFAPGLAQFYQPVNMLTNRIQQLGDATAATDALNMRTADARYLPVSGGTLSGPLIAPGLYATADQGLALYDDGAGNQKLQFQPGWALSFDPDDGLSWVVNGSYVVSIGDDGTINANGIYVSGYIQAYGGSLTGLLDMRTSPITGLADAQNPTDALNLRTADARYAPITLADEIAALRAEFLTLRGSA
jgi:hypothetical protein